MLVVRQPYRAPMTSTPPLPLKVPHIPTNRDHKARSRATFGGSRETSTSSNQAFQTTEPETRAPLGVPIAALAPPRPPNVALLRALWSVLDGSWGVLKSSWGVLADMYEIFIRYMSQDVYLKLFVMRYPLQA